jgi:hypothetical protein
VLHQPRWPVHHGWCNRLLRIVQHYRSIHTHLLCVKPTTTLHMWCHEALYHNFAAVEISSLQNMQIVGLHTSGANSTTVALSVLFASLCPPQNPLYDARSHNYAHSVYLSGYSSISFTTFAASASQDIRALQVRERFIRLEGCARELPAQPSYHFMHSLSRRHNILCTASIRIEAELFPSELLYL